MGLRARRPTGLNQPLMATHGELGMVKQTPPSKTTTDTAAADTERLSPEILTGTRGTKTLEAAPKADVIPPAHVVEVPAIPSRLSRLAAEKDEVAFRDEPVRKRRKTRIRKTENTKTKTTTTKTITEPSSKKDAAKTASTETPLTNTTTAKTTSSTPKDKTAEPAKKPRKPSPKPKAKTKANAKASTGTAVAVTSDKNTPSPEVTKATTAAPRKPAPKAKRKPSAGSPLFMLGGGVAAVFWLAAVAAYHFGFLGLEGLMGLTPTQWLGLAVVALSPSVFMLTSAWFAQLAAEARAESRRLREMTETLLSPNTSSAQGAAETLSGNIRSELSALEDGLESFIKRFAELDEQLAGRTDALRKSGLEAQGASLDISETLRTERKGLEALATRLSDQAQDISQAIGKKSKMVVEASEMADAQLRQAGEKLDAQTEAMSMVSEKMSTASDQLSAQSERAVELTESQTEALVAAIETLRDQQETLAELTSQLDAHQTNLSELAEKTHANTQDAVTATQSGAQALHDMMDAVVQQANRLKDMAHDERATTEEHIRASLSALESLSEKTRESLDEVKAAAGSHVDLARNKIEQLGEATFELAERSDKAIDHQLQEAQKMVQRSSVVVDEAASRLTEGLESGLDEATRRLQRVEDDIQALLKRLEHLPGGVEKHADGIRQALHAGLENIHATAHQAAQDAQSFEKVFEGRIRAHTEAMGHLLAQLGQPMPPLPAFGKSPTQQKPTQTVAKTPSAKPANPKTAELKASGKTTKATPAKPVSPKAEKTKHDEDGWTWKDLLSSLDGGPSAHEETLANIEGVIAALNIKPTAALPDEVLVDILATYRAEGAGAATALTLRMAPASVRRLGTHLEKTPSFKSDANDFVRTYGLHLEDALHHDNLATGDRALKKLLLSDTGRAYLILRAALNAKGKPPHGKTTDD